MRVLWSLRQPCPNETLLCGLQIATQFLLIGLALLTDTLLRSICVFEQSREAAPRRRLRLLGGDSETNRNCRAAPGPVTSGESGTKPAPNRNMVSASDGAPDIVDHMGLRSSRSSWPISEY